MKIIFNLLIITLIISCKSKITTPHLAQTALAIQLDEDGLENDSIKIYEVKQYFDKDSIRVSDFSINFYHNNQFIDQKTVQLREQDIENWYSYNYALQKPDTDVIDPRFHILNIGYPACGYPSDNFLFFFDGKKMNLLHSNTNFSDSGYGTHTEFIPTYNSKNRIIDLKSRIVTVDYSEKSTQEIEMVKITYQDMIHFNPKFNGEKEYLSPKGKVYHTEEKSFQEFHKN